MSRDRHERIVRFRTARRDPELVVVEGFHALKHALRFGAEPLETVALDPAEQERLAQELAPDLADRFGDLAEQVDAEEMAAMAPVPPRTGVLAITRRPPLDLTAVLADPRPAPVVLMEDPRNMGNVGACVRSAAAADAAAVLTTGGVDPWYPDAVRSAAGLHFALPVATVDSLPVSDRPLLAVDPDGETLRPDETPPRAVLAFGTERHGLSEALLARAEGRVGIPMQEGVSSLNLAASVAVVLFAMRLRAE